MRRIQTLPFYERPDLTPYLVHLTRNSRADDGRSAYKNLINILEEGRLRPSQNEPGKGYIKGAQPATCLMDVPFASLKYVLNERDVPKRYEPFGIVITKFAAYKRGCRPVLYLSDQEMAELQISDQEKWRVVELHMRKKGMVSWVHEREWRCKGELKLPRSPFAVLVKTTKQARRLGSLLREHPKRFKSIPRSVIPLELICQGLPVRRRNAKPS